MIPNPAPGALTFFREHRWHPSFLFIVSVSLGEKYRVVWDPEGEHGWEVGWVLQWGGSEVNLLTQDPEEWAEETSTPTLQPSEPVL